LVRAVELNRFHHPPSQLREINLVLRDAAGARPPFLALVFTLTHLPLNHQAVPFPDLYLSSLLQRRNLHFSCVTPTAYPGRSPPCNGWLPTSTQIADQRQCGRTSAQYHKADQPQLKAVFLVAYVRPNHARSLAKRDQPNLRHDARSSFVISSSAVLSGGVW